MKVVKWSMKWANGNVLFQTHLFVTIYGLVWSSSLKFHIRRLYGSMALFAMEIRPPEKLVMNLLHFLKFPHMGKLFQARPGTTKAPGLFTEQVKLFCIISVWRSFWLLLEQIRIVCQKHNFNTRMHSSRMRGCVSPASVAVSWGRVCLGGVCLGGCTPGGVTA